MRSKRRHRSPPPCAASRAFTAALPSIGLGTAFRFRPISPATGLPPERVSPFVLMDYGPPKEFTPLGAWQARRRLAPAPWVRDRHAGLGGRGRPPGQRRSRWHHRARRRPVDDRRARHLPRGVPRGRVHPPRRPHAHDAALGESAREGQGGTAAYQPITAADIPRVALASGGEVRVIAGDYEGARGPAHTFTPITMLDVRLSGGRDAAGPLAALVQRPGRGGRRGASRPVTPPSAPGELILFANDGHA